MNSASPYFTKTFWINTAERVIRTGATTALGAFITDKTGVDLDWAGGLKIVGISMLGTLLICLAAKTTGDPESPSFLLAAAPKIQDPPAGPRVVE